MTIGVPVITGLPKLYQQCTNGQKQSNSKNDHRCTNRHMSTQSPPNTQSLPERDRQMDGQNLIAISTSRVSIAELTRDENNAKTFSGHITCAIAIDAYGK